MRITKTIIILFSLLFICGIVSAYYTITPDKTFIINDTTYSFIHTTNVTTLGKNGNWFIVDNLYMQTTNSGNHSVKITINSLDISSVDFTYSANGTCTIVFNCSGNFFSKVYLGGEETIKVILPIISSDTNTNTDTIINNTLINITDGFDNTFGMLNIFLIITIISLPLMAIYMMVGNRGFF